MRWTTIRPVVYLIFIAIALIGLLYLTSSNTDPFVGYALIAVPVVAAAVLEVWQTVFIVRRQRNRCKILLFGLDGSGKTRFIHSLITLAYDQPMQPTMHTRIYHSEANVYQNGNHAVPFAMLDYRGDLQINALRDGIAHLTHHRANNKQGVDAIIVLLDFFPALEKVITGDSQSQRIEYLDDKAYFETIMDLYTPVSGLERADKRVDRHDQYHNEFAIKSLLHSALGENTSTICFIVTKKDILRELASRGQIRDLSSTQDALKTFAIDHFKPIIERYKQVAYDNFQIVPINDDSNRDGRHLLDDDIRFVSSTAGDETQRVLADILKAYLRKNGR